VTTIRRRIPVSGVGTRIPVRVEDPMSGRAVATTVTGRDGSWQVNVPAGSYRVTEKWGRAYEVTVPGSGSWDVDSLIGGTSAVSATRTAPDSVDMARTLARHKRAARAGS
jgi:hypothetical protein